MEADWKRFRALVPMWRERYLAERVQVFTQMLNDSTKTPTARFWEVEKAMKEEAKTLVACFDGHSRSSMTYHMALMRGHGVIRPEDGEGFSEDLQVRYFRDWPPR